MIKTDKVIEILSDLQYTVYYSYENKTVYIQPPVKVKHFKEIKKMLEYYDLDIKNIVVGKVNESFD